MTPLCIGSWVGGVNLLQVAKYYSASATGSPDCLLLLLPLETLSLTSVDIVDHTYIYLKITKILELILGLLNIFLPLIMSFSLWLNLKDLRLSKKEKEL